MAQSNHTDINHIANAIRDKILRGIYPPGDKLSENGLAGEFSCSRTPIREALKRLEADHLVEILPQSGTYVRIPTLEEAIEITEIRASLESLAFSLACGRHAPCDTLELLADQMEAILTAENIDFVLFGKTHYHFHNHIVILSGNAMLKEVYARLNIAFASIFYSSMGEDEIQKTIEEHRKIVDYLRDGDAEGGSRFMYSHLWAKRGRLMSSHERES